MKHYRIDILVTGLVTVLVGVYLGISPMISLLILAALEISLSFDNAVVNATVLRHMNEWWQKIFVTVGILIAVVGMRFLFPIAIVWATAGIPFFDVVDLALYHSDVYGARLHEAHSEIAMLGGIFLLMVFLNFMFEERETTWLGPLERVLARGGRFDTLAAMIAITVILVISTFVPSVDQLAVLVTGLISLGMYLGLNIFAEAFEQEDDKLGSETVPRAGMAAFALFMYLEFQDASFSFDGVIGAFAVTNNIVVIAAGLGIGALFVRSMTVHLLRTNKLVEFRYLEHGAHWAIGALAVCLLGGVFVEISEYVVGLIGVTVIVAAVIHSRKDNKKEALEAPANVVLEQ